LRNRLQKRKIIMNIKNDIIMNIHKLSIIIIVLFSTVVFYSCGKNGQPKTEEHKKLSLVKVEEVKTSTFVDNFKVVGIVKPYATAKISSEEGGLILSINKDKGSRVSQGEVVAHIKKDVETATLEQNEAQYELAKVNFEKQQELWKANATTELQYLTAKWQMEAAKRGLEVLKTHISKSLVRSPISGVVDEKYMNKGEMSAPGAPILNVVDVSRVKITAGVPEKYVNEVKKGQQVKITVDVLPGVEFSGKISYLSPSLASGSRTFDIEIVINNKDRLLKPEMNANVEITKYERDDAIVVPQDLIVDLGDDRYVFVLEGDIAKKKSLEIDGRNGNMVLVTNGLKAGDKLIYEGFQSLVDGDKVQVVN
jgi:membrane fusion protein (multidrug efflux system)